MKTLITGGTGLLGRHLVPALQQRGDTLCVLALPGEDTFWLEQAGVAVYRGDIRKPETLTAPMQSVERVVHAAALMGVWRPMDQYEAINVTGTENVCRAALAEGVRRFVHVSSWSVYGMDLGRTATEDSPMTPFQEPYAITKAEADKLVQRLIAEEGLPAVIVRPGTFFGPGDRLHFGRMADRLASGRSIIVGSGHNALPFVYVSDVVNGLLLALDHDQALGQIYNITNDQPLTQKEVWHTIAQEIGTKPPRLHVPYRALYAAGYAAERFATATHSQSQPLVTRLGVKLFGTDNRHSIDKARRQLGYSPQVPLRVGLELAGAWYRSRTRGPLPGLVFSETREDSLP